MNSIELILYLELQFSKVDNLFNVHDKISGLSASSDINFETAEKNLIEIIETKIWGNGFKLTYKIK